MSRSGTPPRHPEHAVTHQTHKPVSHEPLKTGSGQISRQRAMSPAGQTGGVVAVSSGGEEAVRQSLQGLTLETDQIIDAYTQVLDG